MFSKPKSILHQRECRNGLNKKATQGMQGRFTGIGSKNETKYDILLLLQLVRYISNLDFTEAVHNCKQLPYWKLDLVCLQIF